MVTLGSLFAGIGGLDDGVTAALDGRPRLAWYSEIDPHPAAVMARHHPDVPNLGDITKITVPPRVDILTGGSPCQDLSTAGRRAGLRDGTRSGLWDHMARIIAATGPRLVVWENVLGALNAPADPVSPLRMGPDNRPLDGTEYDPRAIGRVLSDLAILGYDAAWRDISAAAVGLPHLRRRIILIAWPANSTVHHTWQTAPLPIRTEWETSAPLLPTPTASRLDAKKHGNRSGGASLWHVVTHDLWADYREAEDRAARTIGRPHPARTRVNKTRRESISTAYVEWMMGLPPGYVTNNTDIPISAQNRALGNMCTPRQAHAAVANLLDRTREATP